METSIFIAKILAVVYCAIGIGVLLNTDYYKRAFDEMINNPGLMSLRGLIALTLGFLIISSHNVWEAHWTVLVTIIGWLAFTKGISILVFPETLTRFSQGILQKRNSLKVIGAFAFSLGLIFGYFGFLA